MEKREHESTWDCWCETRIVPMGLDFDGKPLTMIFHTEWDNLQPEIHPYLEAEEIATA